jgi:hypothetical protein
VASASRAGGVEQGGGDMDQPKQSGAAESRSCGTHNREGDGGGQARVQPYRRNPFIPRCLGRRTRPGLLGHRDHGSAANHGWAFEALGHLLSLARPTHPWAGPKWAGTRKPLGYFDLLLFLAFLLFFLFLFLLDQIKFW